MDKIKVGIFIMTLVHVILFVCALLYFDGTIVFFVYGTVLLYILGASLLGYLQRKEEGRHFSSVREKINDSLI